MFDPCESTEPPSATTTRLMGYASISVYVIDFLRKSNNQGGD